MQRRRLMQLGLGASALLAVSAAGIAWQQAPVLTPKGLAPAGQTIFRALSLAVLEGLLPGEPSALHEALEGQLQRVQATITGLPAAAHQDLQRLLTLLAHPAGRLALAGLAEPWASATPAQVAAALQGMRHSILALKQQAYHGLRDITLASHVAAPQVWAQLGYPGPLAV